MKYSESNIFNVLQIDKMCIYFNVLWNTYTLENDQIELMNKFIASHTILIVKMLKI